MRYLGVLLLAGVLFSASTTHGWSAQHPTSTPTPAMKPSVALANTPVPPPAPRPISSPAPGPYLGVSIPGDTQSQLEHALTQFQSHVRHRAAIVMLWREWGPTSYYNMPDARLLSYIHAQGSAPLISWTPNCWACGTTFSLSNIAAGRYDRYIRSFADAMKAYGHPIFLRFAHEMNGGWYPWALQPPAYIAAWQHVHNVFVAQGATNVIWVWSPNIWQTSQDGTRADGRDYWPGAAYVDWVALDGYNKPSDGWNSFSTLFSHAAGDLAPYAKPLMIAETASSEPLAGQPTKASWITDALESAPALSVKALLWFNEDKRVAEHCTCDWPIESDPRAMIAFAVGAHGYQNRYTAVPTASPTNTPAPTASATPTPVPTARPTNTAVPNTVTPIATRTPAKPVDAVYKVYGAIIQFSPKPNWSLRAHTISWLHRGHPVRLGMYVHVQPASSGAMIWFHWIVMRGGMVVQTRVVGTRIHNGNPYYFVAWPRVFWQPGRYRFTAMVGLDGKHHYRSATFTIGL